MLHTFVLTHKIVGNTFLTHLHVMPIIPSLHFFSVLRVFKSPFSIGINQENMGGDFILESLVLPATASDTTV
jgi:hypothetical protein